MKHRITIEELLKILQKEQNYFKTSSEKIGREVYDGAGNRDLFQEGYNLGNDQAIERIIHLITDEVEMELEETKNA